MYCETNGIYEIHMNRTDTQKSVNNNPLIEYLYFIFSEKMDGTCLIKFYGIKRINSPEFTSETLAGKFKYYQ